MRPESDENETGISNWVVVGLANEVVSSNESGADSERGGVDCRAANDTALSNEIWEIRDFRLTYET